jgi:polyhydroxyalkanoate synthase
VTDGNSLTVGGRTLSLHDVTCDTFLVGGETDHITPWDGCYLSTKALGGKSEFVLSQSGHIQSLINPPGNPKARFLTNSGEHSSAEEFKAGAEARAGSWWPMWLTWLNAHAGARVRAPKALGSRKHEPLGEAPGRYVLEAA